MPAGRSLAREGPLVAPDTPPQKRARVEEIAHRLTGASARAISMRLGLRPRGARWELDGRPFAVRAPHLHPRVDLDGWVSFRGAADAVAQLARHSDPELRRSLRPDGDVVAALVYELLEQLRVESLADPTLPGVGANLALRFRAWSEQVQASGLLETEQGILLFTVAHICRARVLATPMDDAVVDAIEATRWGIVGAIGGDLALLRGLRADQERYAASARRIARAVSAQLAMVRTALGQEAEDEQPGGPEALLSFLAGFDEDGEEAAAPVAELTRSERGGGAQPAYRAFTTAHDKVDLAADLVPRLELGRLRGELDELVRRSGLHVNRLAQHAYRTLGAPDQRGWDHNLEEGLLDPQALNRLVAHPGDGRIFRAPHSHRSTTVAVTFLLDCSGSMKQHAGRLAPLVDVMSAALVRAGATVEVLGYTTRSWGGALARKDWQRSGRPAAPGRLTELQHLVFVPGDVSGRRARGGLAALLRPSLYREGVDGEALQWAAARLEATEARRRVLVVLCDGSPMETSTERANGAGYLDEHLRDTVRAITTRGAVEVKGVGVGLDLSSYYDDYAVLDLAGSLVHAAHELLAVVARRHVSPSRR
jgi:cobaltochelatase CobT